MEEDGATTGPRSAAGRTRLAWKTSILVVLFLLGFLLASRAVIRLTSRLTGVESPAQLPLEESDFKERVLLRQLKESGAGEYGLFFGPSTMRHGVIPEIFDRALQERGRDVYSFNMGINGAGGHEVDYLTRHTIARIAEEGLPLPDWVVVDLTLPHHRLALAHNSDNIQNIRSSRSVRWHDFYQTLSVVQTIFRIDSASAAVKLRSLALHLEAFVRRSFEVSGIWQQLRSMNGNTRAHQARRVEIAEHRGYIPYEGEVYEIQRRVFRERGRDAYRATLRDREAGIFPQSFDVEIYNDAAVKRQADDLRRHGIQVVYIISPTHRDTRFVEALAARQDLPPLLRYDRPAVFPELYVPEHRQDEGHLSWEGAVLYSEQLARDLSDILEESGGP